MNLPALRSPTTAEKILLVGPDHLVRNFAEVLRPITTFAVAGDVAEARVRLIGRGLEAIVVLAQGGGPETLAAVQILAGQGVAPLLLVAPGLPTADQLVAL